MKKTNISHKNSDLNSILDTRFNNKLNKARVKLIAMMIVALTKVQSVNFNKLSKAFDTESQADSSLRRIQRFIAEFSLDSNLVAKLIFSLLPHKENLTLSIDRTNWKFGKLDINIFMLGVVYEGVAFPLLFTMLPKRGNSNSQERIDLIMRYIDLFGKNTIDCIVADREFIGEKWLSFLIENKIKFHIRIPKSHYIEFKNQRKRGDELLNIHGKCFLKGIKIKGFTLNIAMDFSKNKNGEDDPLLVLTNTKNENTLGVYKERWSIEVLFQSLKKRGFNLEDTHLKDTDRIAKLFALTNIAFVICLTIGGYADACEKEIPVKNHGYKANSYFRHGLNIVRELLTRPILMKERLEDLSIFVLNFAKSIFDYSTKKMVKIKSEKIIM
jgi:hypothetical protein